MWCPRNATRRLIESLCWFYAVNALYGKNVASHNICVGIAICVSFLVNTQISPIVVLHCYKQPLMIMLLVALFSRSIVYCHLIRVFSLIHPRIHAMCPTRMEYDLLKSLPKASLSSVLHPCQNAKACVADSSSVTCMGSIVTLIGYCSCVWRDIIEDCYLPRLISDNSDNTKWFMIVMLPCDVCAHVCCVL